MDSMPMHLRKHWTKFMHFLESKRIRIILVKLEKKLKNKLNKFRYRTHLIDSFNRDPIQCKCGAIMQYTYTYNPLEDKRNDRTYRKRCIDEMMRMYKRRI